ncbi:hypothetical protein ABTE05_20985, partial [Acinetobacter baumannii]
GELHQLHNRQQQHRQNDKRQIYPRFIHRLKDGFSYTKAGNALQRFIWSTPREILNSLDEQIVFQVIRKSTYSMIYSDSS